MATTAAPVESTGEITQRGRVENLRPRWQKGQSGNPGGRPAGLSKRIREATADGEDLITFMVGVLKNGREKTADRITAATWLADRCWGKPAQTLELREAEPSLREQLSALSVEEQDALRVRVLTEIAERLGRDEQEQGAEAADAEAADGEPRALPAATS